MNGVMQQQGLFGTDKLKSVDIVPPNPGLLGPQEETYWEVAWHIQQGRNVCLQAPTGAGKTTMSFELLNFWKNHGFSGAFYVNRKALISQTSQRFKGDGLVHGVRAAEYEDMFYPDEPMQICSAPTEWARVYGETPSWRHHEADVVVVDEAHMMKGEMMQRILEDHMGRGARVVLMSATPVGLSKVIPNLTLVKSGTLAAYRECGLLVPAVTRSPSQPDMRKVKRGATGEFVLDDTTRRQFVQHIVGDVIKHWKEWGDGKPTMMYAPGKAESVWLAEQFNNAGIRTAHVDANEIIMDGKRTQKTRSRWDELLERYRNGEITCITSRFCTREGVDCPWTEHIVLATPIGSLSSYLQVAGRGLRASKATGKDVCQIQDHGGSYHRHGSVNADRPWDLLWQMSQGQASKFHEYEVRHKEREEPIRCPNCLSERTGGSKCPLCDHESRRGSRHIIMEDGSLKEVEDRLTPTVRTRMHADTQSQWNKMYFGFKNKKLERTFVQMEAFFANEHGYWPPRTLANQPKNNMDWHRYVYSVDVRDQTR